MESITRNIRNSFLSRFSRIFRKFYDATRVRRVSMRIFLRHVNQSPPFLPRKSPPFSLATNRSEIKNKKKKRRKTVATDDKRNYMRVKRIFYFRDSFVNAKIYASENGSGRQRERESPSRFTTAVRCVIIQTRVTVREVNQIFALSRR